MNLILFCIYAVITLISVIFLALREFHMLQLNGYKTPEHSWWMKKNYKRYVFPLACFLLQFILLLTGASVPMITAFSLFNISIALANKPGKKFKKPFVYTARVKRMLTTFFILIAIIFACAVFVGYQKCKCEAWREHIFTNPLSYILIGSALYLTPVLVPLANIINKPIETYIQHWFINDAKRILSEMPDLHKVGITGSYGKTSMKFYLSELLASQYETLKTPESFNTPMGVTITVRRDLKPTHEYFICEMGARRVHEIKELCGIANPHDGIITSVGPQHLETFGSIENVVNTKFELADSVSPLGKIYLNGDNELIRAKVPEYTNAITYGLQEGNDWRATDVTVSDRGTEFTVTSPDGKSCRYTTKLLGEHSVLNLTGAIAYAVGTGIPMEKLVLPVKRISAVPHRLQLLDKGNGVTFIDDAYNSNPSGCRAALSVLKLFDACRILVTPGMVELGAKQEELNYEFGQEASEACDYIVLVGRNQTVPIYNGIKDSGYNMEQVYVADNLNDALAKVQAYQTDRKKIVLLENDLPDNY
ncbi:MAG: UDP-N-acetylmuramoyl-tripeptide--D-alanyl-D-alanine ligase [Ruminococcus flavefaciens]|nr:UDP-N-acetylmuramoyl-tripeptide--D-alanyl-D-alanine ligase [Ruminococcus flavefaciens]MCM1228858.1 UDP-N-acetylmuramoyl-tripeptide--D-alanyl-D-alanine ligase [Ruminococcus flavefaciens]